MAHNTRSQSSRASSESGELSLSQVELEVISKKLQDKEKLIQEQAQALRDRQIELDEREADINKEKNATVGTEGLSTVLYSLRQEIASFKNLPAQIEQLTHRVNGLTLQPGVITTPVEDSQQQNILADELRVKYDNSPRPIHSPSEFVSPIRFKDVIDSIPRYDGHKPPVFQFSKICERAYKLIPPQQEQYLVQLIINKLHGHAYTAIEGMNFSTVASLTYHLKKIFGPNKSLNQYRGELGNLYMLPSEDIFYYIERTKELRSAIMDGEINLYGSLSPQDEDRIDQDVLESFINGLPTDLLVRVKLEGQFSNLDSAIASTIQLSKTLEAESRRKKHAYPIKPNSTPRVDFPARNPTTTNLRSNTNNHSTFQRPSNQPFIKPLIPGQLGPNSPNAKICKYCKNPGHLIHECRKLAYRRSFENIPGTTEPMPGNSMSVSENQAAHRNANQIERPNPTKIVRFQQAPTPISTSPN